MSTNRSCSRPQRPATRPFNQASVSEPLGITEPGSSRGTEDMGSDSWAQRWRVALMEQGEEKATRQGFCAFGVPPMASQRSTEFLLITLVLLFCLLASFQQSQTVRLWCAMYSVFISQTRVSDHLARHIVSKTPSLPGLIRTVLAYQRSSKILQQYFAYLQCKVQERRRILYIGTWIKKW